MNFIWTLNPHADWLIGVNCFWFGVSSITCLIKLINNSFFPPLMTYSSSIPLIVTFFMTFFVSLVIGLLDVTAIDLGDFLSILLLI